MINDRDLLFVPCDELNKEKETCDFLHIVDGEIVSFPTNIPYKDCILSDYYYISSKKDCQQEV